MICSAADARSVGPVHGRKFTPAAIEATHARIRLSIRSRSKSGSMAGIVTRNVTAPEPSRCTSSASSAEPTTIRRGRVPTPRRMRSTIGIEQAGVGHDPEVQDREHEHRRHGRGLLQAA